MIRESLTERSQLLRRKGQEIENEKKIKTNFQEPDLQILKVNH